MNKRFVSFILTLAMVLSMVPMFVTVAFADDDNTDWKVLQKAIKGTIAEGEINDFIEYETSSGIDGSTMCSITLLTDVAFGEEDEESLCVPEGMDVTIDLNGYTLDRGLREKDATPGGFVIKVESGASLTITDTSTSGSGTITGGNNSSDGNGDNVGGGVHVAKNGTLIMSGGAITGNKATNGGGVYVNGGSFTMSSGEITSNSAISGNGGGVYVNGGSFTMSSGEITSNSASGSGGGVYVINGTFNMTGSSMIYSNNCKYFGGGVHVNGGSFTMSSGEITSNSAISGSGGGVYVINGTFNMTGSSMIYSNSGSLGGGVCINTNGKFNMTGGVITNNTATSSGGGVYYGSGTVTLGGIAKITGNVKGGTPNNFYLPNNKYIQFGTYADAPQEGMSVGVTTATAPNENNPVTISAIGADGYHLDYFFSDNSDYCVECDDESEVLKLSTKYPLWVGGTQVTLGNKSNVLNVLGDATVIYDNATHTLTLSGAAIECIGDEDNGIYAECEELTIVLADGTENCIGSAENPTLYDNYSVAFGIAACENIVFTGGGNLVIYDSTKGITSYAGDIIFDESFTGKLTIYDYGYQEESEPQPPGCAINAAADLIISGGSFDLISYNSNAISAGGNVNIAGGEVKLKCGPTDAYAITAGGVLNINDSLVISNATYTKDVTTALTPSDKNAYVVICPITYTVTFNMNEHGEQVESQEVEKNGKVTKPIDPIADGYTFGGWYKEALCVNEWSFETNTVATDTTLYAKWTEIPAPPAPVYYYDDVTYYDVVTSAGVNGTIDVNKKSASYGSTVTVTVTPEKGFALETLTVLDKNGKEIEVKDTKEKNKYTFRMPSSKATVNVTFMEDNTILNYCVDVKKERYYYDAVLWAYENEICKGTDELHFSPNKTLTRAEAVTFLWRIAGKPVVNYWMQFKDVESGRYYTEAVRWAASEKIAIGYSNEKFGTTDLITREQLATMIYRYVQKKGEGFTGSWMFLLPYEDRAKISDWANEAAHWCSMKGVIKGKSGNLFDPQGTATRAEAVTMLYRFDSLMK